MARFEMGYPKRTGNDSEDVKEMYNFICELSDRLRYTFNQLEKEKENERNEQ